jgi:hypothetical protein
MAKDGQSVWGIRFPYLQFDPAEGVGVPTREAEHMLADGEALDASRFQAGARQQEFHLVVKAGDGDELGVGLEHPGSSNFVI